MRIPLSAAPDVAQCLREIWQTLDTLNTQTHLQVVDLRGRRIVNAGNGMDSGDYVTVAQLAERSGSNASNENPVVITITVKQLTRLLGMI